MYRPCGPSMMRSARCLCAAHSHLVRLCGFVLKRTVMPAGGRLPAQGTPMGPPAGPPYGGSAAPRPGALQSAMDAARKRPAAQPGAQQQQQQQQTAATGTAGTQGPSAPGHQVSSRPRRCVASLRRTTMQADCRQRFLRLILPSHRAFL